MNVKLTKGKVIAICVLLVITYYGITTFQYFMDLDNCLDAGGRWIENQSQCVFEIN